MLHQISLYRNIPKLKAEIDGFRAEVQTRLCENDEEIAAINKHKKMNPMEAERKTKLSYHTRQKYMKHLEIADKAKAILSDLHRCTNE